jgi:hypothetical protein
MAALAKNLTEDHKGHKDGGKSHAKAQSRKGKTEQTPKGGDL